MSYAFQNASLFLFICSLFFEGTKCRYSFDDRSFNEYSFNECSF